MNCVPCPISRDNAQTDGAELAQPSSEALRIAAIETAGNGWGLILRRTGEFYWPGGLHWLAKVYSRRRLLDRNPVIRRNPVVLRNLVILSGAKDLASQTRRQILR
jgi:hypothetical protein